MTKLFYKVFRFLLAPLKESFHVFITIFILHSIVDTIYFYQNKLYALSVFSFGLLFAYLFTLFYWLLRSSKRMQKIYIRTIYTLYITSFSIDIITHSTIGASLDEDLISALFATNLSEASEAIKSYFSFTALIIGGIILIITFLINKIIQRHTINSILIYLSFIGVIISGMISTKMNLSMLGGFMGKMYLFSITSSKPSIMLSNEIPLVEINKKEQPKNIVLIMGESLSKTHCSSYGYDKITTPNIDSLKKTPFLFQFSHIISPDVNTIGAISQILSLCPKNENSSTKRYEYPTIINLLRHVGYNTLWISNQSKRGVFDNYITKYAEQCSKNYFMGNPFLGLKHNTFDEVILDTLSSILPTSNEKDFFFIHLIGSHLAYRNRYPSDFDKFKASDYLSLPKHQRTKIATYDNSVLYNDFVINNIIKMFSDEETIIFYFSDHAQDLYQSSPDYCGHGQRTKESYAWGQKIPFYIYMSEKFQNKFPSIVKRVKQHQEDSNCTDNMFYTIMDIIGIKFTTNNDVEKYSMLQ